MPEQAFQFQYTVFQVDARMTESHLIAKMGIKHIQIPLDQLEFIYLDDRRRLEHWELIISYRTPKGGRKRARLYSNSGETGLRDLTDALARRSPGSELRGITPAEAYEKMGSKNWESTAIPGLMIVSYLVVAILCSPLFIHGFDDGESKVSIRRIQLDQATESRNLVIQDAVLRMDHAIVENNEMGGDPTMGRTWVPVVSEGWSPGNPVKMVVEVRNMHLEKLHETGPLTGILRNVWWEGLSARNKRRFDDIGITVADDVWLLEVGTDHGDDLGLALLILGCLAVPVVGATVVLRRRKA